MQIKTQRDKIKNNLERLKTEHQTKIKAEEEMLVNAKFDLPTLDYLKQEAEVEANRAVRIFSINQLEKSLKTLDQELSIYMSELRAKTEAMRKVRDEKFLEHYKTQIKQAQAEMAKGWDYHFRKNGRPYMTEANRINLIHVTTVENEYGHYLARWRNYISGINRYQGLDATQFTRPLTRYYYLRQYGSGPIERKTYTPIPRVEAHRYDKYAEYFGVSIDWAFKMFNSSRKNNFLNNIKPLRSHKIGDNIKILEPINHLDARFIPVVHRSRVSGHSKFLGAELSVYDVIDYFYPSVQDYEKNPELFPHAIGFLEETPFPDKKAINKAFKNLLGVGTVEWGESQLDTLKAKAEYNTRELKPGQHYSVYARSVLALPDGYYDRDKKETVSIPYRNFVPYGPADPALDPANDYYAPRPKEGHLFVPEYDYINPLEYVEYQDRSRRVLLPQGEYLKAVEEAKRREEQEAKRQKWQRFRAEMRAALGGGLVGMLMSPGGLIVGFTCFQHGYDSRQCKSMQDFASFARGVTQIYIAAMVGYATGGVGASIAGAVSAVASDPQLGIGDSDIGKVLLALAEAYAIANVTNTAIDKALGEVLENQIYQITKREIGKQTGLDKTLLGRVGLDLSTGTAFGMYKNQEFMNALTGSADKSWRLAVARENPYGAILMAGVTEIEKNGWSINSTNPLDWFDNINVGDEFKRVRHSIRGKDLAKLIGLTYMVQAGRISEGDAMLMIGQEASKRNLEKFYQDKPIVEDPEMEAYRKKQAEVGRWKQGIAVMQKLATGVPPTKEDVMIISDNVAGPIYDRIQSLGLPTKYEVNLWDIAINQIGLPNVANITPDMSFDLPEWMRSKQSDGHVVITNKEQMENYLGKKFTQDAELTKEDLVQIILGMFPRNVPLIPVSTGPQTPSFNFIDDMGSLKIRDALKFPFDHPMLKAGHIPKRYTKKQEQYIKAREQELLIANAKMRGLTQKLEELQQQGSMS